MSTPDTSGAVHCAAHPSTVTYLRCAQCNLPICPRCLVMTPVGAKCRDCARARLQPAFVLTPVDIVIATVTTVVGGFVFGVCGSLIARLVPFLGILIFLFPLAAGIVTSRLVRLVLPKKHGFALKIAIALGVILAFFALGLGDFVMRDPLSLFEPAVAGPMVRNWLLSFVVNPFAFLFLALGVYVGINQVD